MTRLAEREVRVWALAPSAPALLSGLGLLDETERQRAARKLDPTDRESFEAAHVLLRLALSSVASVEAAAWRFLADAHGRPWLAPPHDRLGLAFNLSHARGLVAVAVARGRRVGVDAEDVSRPFEDALARDCFTVDELRSMRVEDRVAHFSLKEAYAKARGLGLAIGLRTFAVSLQPARLVPDDAGWQLATWRVAPGHVVSLAASRQSEAPLAVSLSDRAPE